MNREWGIAFPHSPNIMHRGPFTLEQAKEWIRESEQDGFRIGFFVIISREVSEWTLYE